MQPAKGKKSRTVTRAFIGFRPVTVVKLTKERALIKDQDGDKFVVAAHKLKNISTEIATNIAA